MLTEHGIGVEHEVVEVVAAQHDARAIRAGEVRTGHRRTPIVALTADALEDGKKACQQAGMDGFLTKPVDPAELEEMFLMLFPSEERAYTAVA